MPRQFAEPSPNRPRDEAETSAPYLALTILVLAVTILVAPLIISFERQAAKVYPLTPPDNIQQSY